MKKEVVVVYDGIGYDEFQFDVEVEKIPLPPKDGWQLFRPGIVTYTVQFLNGKKFVTNIKPYRFVYQDTIFFVFHTI